jgi:heterodisulfide reductase subunit A-like polyferredoxin
MLSIKEGVTVIGGGVVGLAVAMNVAKGGREVILLEQ